MKLDQLVIIRNPTFTKSASGEDLRDLTGTPFATVWAAVEVPRANSRSREVFEAMRDTGEQWFDVTIRRLEGLNTSMWVEWDSTIYGSLLLDVRFFEPLTTDRAGYVKLTARVLT